MKWPRLPEYQFSTGRPVGSRNMLLYVADGIFHTQAEIDEARAKGLLYSNNTVPGDIRFKDMNGDGKIDGLDRIRPEKNGTSFCCRSDPDSQVERLRFDDVMAGSSTGAEVYIETWSGLVGNFLKSDYDRTLDTGKSVFGRTAYIGPWRTSIGSTTTIPIS